MCGISGIFGPGVDFVSLQVMIASQNHRGPDDNGCYLDPSGQAGLGHNRLSIIDLTYAGHQPMMDISGRYWLVFNGEIYNYLELRSELSDYPFQSKTDSEVLLAAFIRWGESCLERLIGMFAFLLWDSYEQRLIAARDRFGVKPLYYTIRPDGTLILSSEIKALWAAGCPREPDPLTWATYLTYGLYDHSPSTFWQGIQALPAGHTLTWQSGKPQIACWYDLANCIPDVDDSRTMQEVQEEYLSILIQSVNFRFRSDVPIGINLSGGVDSATLLGTVQKVQGFESDVQAFTFITGDPNYDETPWVQAMIAQTRHPSVLCRLSADQVPDLAHSVQSMQDEPFGGLPTLAYARLFEEARARGVIVLLDGQGMDEQWAGYDYYRSAISVDSVPTVQGSRDPATRPDCLTTEFRRLAEPLSAPQPFSERLRNLQYRDTRYTKIPRALRFNDRVSMRVSVELREPFLDHRLFELALSQPAGYKINDHMGKILLRQMVRDRLPAKLVEAPKRPLQTPQREWLRGPLRSWACEQISIGVERSQPGWFSTQEVWKEWEKFNRGESDNSFFLWQWISLGLIFSGNIDNLANKSTACEQRSSAL